MRQFRNEREFALWQQGRRERWAQGAHIDTTSGGVESRHAADIGPPHCSKQESAEGSRGSAAGVAPGPLTLSLLLPWPPSGNHATKHSTTGAHYLTDEHKRYRAAVASIFAQADAPMITSPYRCEIVWHLPDRRERDSDNLQKVLFDALRHAGAIRGDSMLDKVAYSESVVVPAKPWAGGVLVEIVAI